MTSPFKSRGANTSIKSALALFFPFGRCLDWGNTSVKIKWRKLLDGRPLGPHGFGRCLVYAPYAQYIKPHNAIHCIDGTEHD